jgi:hypothetical protein
MGAVLSIKAFPIDPHDVAKSRRFKQTPSLLLVLAQMLAWAAIAVKGNR